LSLDPIVLDATPLSLLCYPDVSVPIVQEIRIWLRGLDRAGRVVYVPEIADYEVRRELIRARKLRSLRRLDRLLTQMLYLPLDTQAMHRAAEMWAEVRNRGLPTASPDALDADVILAAQAEAVGGIVATENVGHLARLVTAAHWRDIR
jgi:predicted nucleic acid-binding protein